MTALICAANRGHTECLNLLIQYGANLNIKDFHGGTALTYAAKFGNLECLKCLVQSGADINAKGLFPNVIHTYYVIFKLHYFVCR